MKRKLSLVPAMAMLLFLLAAVNSATVFASSSDVHEWKYFDETNQMLYTQKTGEEFGGKFFQKGSGSTGSGVTYYANGNGISNDPVWNIDNTKYICNYTGGLEMTKPVLDFSCKIYIPNGTQANARQIYLSFGKKDASNKYNNNQYGTVYFTLTSSSGAVYGGASSNASNVYRASWGCTADTWHQVNIRAFTNVSGKLTYGMYFDGRLAIVCSSDATDIRNDDLGIYQIYFNNTATTYVKDIGFDLEDYDPIYEPSESEIYLSNVLCNSLTVDAVTNALNVPGYGVSSTILQTSSQTGGHYKSGGVYQNVNYSLEDNALKVALTPSESAPGTHALIQNFMRNITDYFPSGTTKYMQMSYDVKIPAGTESASREQYWRIGNDKDKLTTSCYEIYSNIKNGKLYFTNKSACQGDPLTQKTQSFDVQSDKWYRIISLLKISNGSNDEYTVHTEGYVLDIDNDATYKIYEKDGTIPKLVSGTDGLILTQQRTDVITPAAAEAGTTVDTYYDNMISRIWGTDFSTFYLNPVDTLPADDDYMFEIDLTQTEGVATARGRDTAYNGGQSLLIAGYDSTGNFLSCALSGTAEDENTVIDAEKGIVTLKWDFSSYPTLRTLKAFMFSDLMSMTPLTGASALKVD